MLTSVTSNLTWSRRISTRKSMKAFSARIRQLQNFIVSHGLEVPPPSGQELASTLRTLMEAHASSPSDEQFFGPSQPGLTATGTSLQETELVQLDGPSLDFDPHGSVVGNSDLALQTTMHDDPNTSMSWPDEMTFDVPSTLDADWVWNLPVFDESITNDQPDAPAAAALMDLYASASGRPMHDVSDLCADWNHDNDSTVGEEDHTEVTSQISERMGGLLASREGKWRFYGATSNLHLAKGRLALSSVPNSHPQQKGLIAARLKLLGLDSLIDDSLENHLLDLFFAWHNSSMHIVDHEFFERGRSLYSCDNKHSEFYSEVLVNAMCAVGAALESDRHPSLPAPLSEFFAKRARALLEVELDEPRVATVQGLAIMSCHEASFMHDTRAWLYSGMSHPNLPREPSVRIPSLT
ncbi:hypothetical protein E4T47_01055 [Aureobasidium subglaciale]|nr:hypothetical protein E4T47_01055 [Aureobasidium subglaciale]